MYRLNLEQMDKLNGGSDFTKYVACRVGFCLAGAITGMWWVGVAGVIFCPTGGLD